VSIVRRWDALTRDELRALTPGALLVVPVGTTEQHGPHLATGTDALIATAVAERAAAAARAPETILLAPTLAYGASDHHLPFGGTLSLRVETFGHVLRDLLASAAAAGVRRAFVLNGHGGNKAACAIAVAEAARAHGLLAATALVSDLLDPAAIDGPATGHAGSFETSLILALDPDLVSVVPPNVVRDRLTRRELGDVADRVKVWVDFNKDLETAAGETPRADLVDAGRAVEEVEEDVRNWLHAQVPRRSGPGRASRE